jgi:hypothetical protein
MNMTDDNAFDDEIRRSVSDSVPPDVESRLRARLADFRSGRSAPGAAGGHPARRWEWPAWWGIGVACASAVALLAIAPWLLGPRASFAQVTTAVLKQTWIHVRTVYGDQSDAEQWYSPSRDVSALRHTRSIEYHDDRLRVYDTYDPKEKVVYRVPAWGRSQAIEVESTVKALSVLLQGDRVPDRPLDHLGLLGPDRARMKVIDQAIQKELDGGRTWLDYRLTVDDSGPAGRLQLRFRVDAATKLPASCRIEGRHDGQPAVREMRFDYPEKGPADIYDLGVPRATKVVDRVPKGDLKRIIDTLQAGRERMDDYRAVFVVQYGGINLAWWKAIPRVFYRKGARFRADSVADWKSRGWALERPRDDADRRKWWLERVKSLRFFPESVMRDSSRFSSVVKPVDNPDGSQHAEIVSVHRVNFNSKPEEMFPAEYSMMPEFACRPPMGIGSPHLRPVLDMHPTEGPPGCILLTVKNFPNKNPINEKGIGSPDGFLYWLDLQRDFIVVRCKTVRRDGTGKEVLVEEDIVEETARSPQGVWYATRIRRTFGGKFDDQIYHIYVDFDAVLPDSLFEPPTPGRVP